MLAYISSLLQDICDVSFIVGRGALALILVMMEESRLTWLDLASVQEVREKYCYRSVVAPISSAHSTSFSNQNKPKTVRGAQRCICQKLTLAPVPMLPHISQVGLITSTSAATVLLRALGFPIQKITVVERGLLSPRQKSLYELSQSPFMLSPQRVMMIL